MEGLANLLSQRMQQLPSGIAADPATVLIAGYPPKLIRDEIAVAESAVLDASTKVANAEAKLDAAARIYRYFVPDPEFIVRNQAGRVLTAAATVGERVLADISVVPTATEIEALVNGQQATNGNRGDLGSEDESVVVIEERVELADEDLTTFLMEDRGKIVHARRSLDRAINFNVNARDEFDTARRQAKLANKTIDKIQKFSLITRSILGFFLIAGSTAGMIGIEAVHEHDAKLIASGVVRPGSPEYSNVLGNADPESPLSWDVGIGALTVFLTSAEFSLLKGKGARPAAKVVVKIAEARARSKEPRLKNFV